MAAREAGLGESALATGYAAVRDRTIALTEPLSAEDCCAQSMTEASPAKWHLAHTSWFFETFVLEPHEPGFRPFDPAFRVLFNSYYNGIGAKHPRPQRGMLTRPSLTRVLDYRRNIDARMERLLGQPQFIPVLRELVLLGLHHEQQHQELILTDIKHLLSLNPLQPAYFLGSPESQPTVSPTLAWHAFSGGVVPIGYAGDGFCYDNETPRHDVFLAPYELASRLVTNAEFQEFVDVGGYQDSRLWLSDGWDWVSAAGRRQPCYWRDGPSGAEEFTLGGPVARDPACPVVHISYYEADAFARWAGARLPSEAEWEHASAGQPTSGNFSDSAFFHPRPAMGDGLVQLFGDVWEWTRSSYGPYPGFRPAAGAVGEYNGKFMVNQYVLRGGSCATAGGHVRATYRNFFPASACWQFSGFRLARDN